MKNRFVFSFGLLLFFVLGLLLNSCASLPAPNSLNPTLLVIPLENRYDNPQKVYGTYTLEISRSGEKDVERSIVLPREGKYVLVRGLKPGSYYISSSYFTYFQLEFTGQPERYSEEDTGFELREGEITFTPVVYGQYNYLHKEDDKYYIKRNFSEDPEGTYQEEVYDLLKESFPEDIGAWDVRSFTGE